MHNFAPNVHDPMSTSRQGKRSRGSVACATCRKHKARCELRQIDADLDLSCTRCRSLSIECSLAHSDTATVRVLRHQVALATKPHETLGYWPLGPPLAEDGTPKNMGGSQDPRWRIWHFITPIYDPVIHWSAPVLSIHTFLKRINLSRDPISRTTDSSLRNILTESQIQDLIGTFTGRYNPWICFTPSPQGRSELLDAVQCCIAARHLAPAIRASVSSRLHSLVQNHVAMHILDPEINQGTMLEIIQALTILAVWSPIREEPQGGVAETRTIFSTAVGLAMDLRINQLSGLSQTKDSLLNRAKAALWISLSVMDSLSCIGKGKLPISRRSKEDSIFFRTVKPQSMSHIREMRIGYMARIVDLVEQGFSMKYDAKNGGLRMVHELIAGFIRDLDTIAEEIETACVDLTSERPYFDIVRLQCLIGIILIVYHGMFEVRYAYIDVPEISLHSLKVENKSVLVKYFCRGFEMCEEIMTIVLNCDPHILVTVPDSMFPQIILVAIMCVANENFLCFDIFGDALPKKKFPIHLLAPIAQKLMDCAPSPDHPAAKCGNLLHIVVSHWEAFITDMEVTGRQRGPLDFVIPVLKNQFPSQVDENLLQQLQHDNGLFATRAGDSSPQEDLTQNFVDINESSIFAPPLPTGSGALPAPPIFQTTDPFLPDPTADFAIFNHIFFGNDWRSSEVNGEEFPDAWQPPASGSGSTLDPAPNFSQNLNLY